MKKSKRLLRSTIIALHVLMVVYIGANRLYAGNNVAVQKSRNTPVAELASLRDFSSVEIHGDFNVELVQQADYAVTYEPLDGSQGTFAAYKENNILMLYGHGNRGDAGAATVKISMPAVANVETHEAGELRLSGFSDPVLSVQFDDTRRLTLRNNTVKEWRLTTAGVVEVRVDAATLAAGKINVRGAANITQFD